MVAVGTALTPARKFVSELNCNVFMCKCGGVCLTVVSYRGYGKSEGSPSEAGIKLDAAAAMEWISKNPIVKDTKLIVRVQ